MSQRLYVVYNPQQCENHILGVLDAGNVTYDELAQIKALDDDIVIDEVEVEDFATFMDRFDQ
jgi:hypothetical protein